MSLVSLFSAVLAAVLLLGAVWHASRSRTYARWYRHLFGPPDRY